MIENFYQIEGFFRMRRVRSTANKKR